MYVDGEVLREVTVEGGHVVGMIARNGVKILRVKVTAEERGSMLRPFASLGTA